MLAATNWTAVLTTAATATVGIVVALLGYFGLRLGTKVQREGFKHEMDRLKVEHEREDSNARRKAYTELLNEEREVITELTDDIGGKAARHLMQRLELLDRHANEIRLVSPRPVAEATQRFQRAASAVWSHLDSRAEGAQRGGQAEAQPENVVRLTRRQQRLFRMWHDRRADLENAMRADVSADKLPLDKHPWRDPAAKQQAPTS